MPDGAAYELSVSVAEQDVYHAAVAAAAAQDATWLFLMRWLRPDDAMFDLGANIGTVAIPAALACRQVHAFEMLAENVVHLRRAVARNRLTNLTIVQCAVSDQPGLLAVAGTSAWGVVVAESELLIPAMTIDDYVRLRNIGRVGLIKIDIEGSELRALSGAAATLARDQPDIIIESNSFTCGTNGYSYRDLLREVARFGYTLYRIEAERLAPWSEDSVQEIVHTDYLATRRGEAEVVARAGRPIAAPADAAIVGNILSAARYDAFWRMHVLAVADQLPPAVRADERVKAALAEWEPLRGSSGFSVFVDGTA